MSKSKSRIKDPYAAREAANYEDPIPSREFLLEYLANRGTPATHETLCDELHLASADHIEALRRRLIAMCRDNQLFSNRSSAYAVISQEDLLIGIVMGHPDGFGFVKVEGKSEDVMLPFGQMRGCFDGDKVSLRISGKSPRGRKEGRIIEVLERNTSKIVGRFTLKNGLGFLVPENSKVKNEIIIPAEHNANAQEGDMIECTIITQPDFRASAVARVDEVIGQHMAPGMEIQVAIRNFDIPAVWPEEVKKEVANLKPQVQEHEKIGRIDLTDKAFVTIDGEDARDFDDAVYATTMANGGFKLFVAIADVSHYVRLKTALDEEARVRSTSVYFPQQVVPMLPEILSNGLCSLNPHVDRLAMVCEMEIDAHGSMQNFKFFESVIYSHARLTYTQVDAWLFKNEAQETITDSKVKRSLTILKSLYLKLRANREQRGAIDFETQEPFILFNKDRKIEKFAIRERNDAHKLIEECMLSANVATASFMHQQGLDALYRVHEAPTPERLETLRGWLGELGLQLLGGEKPTSADFQRLIAQTKDRPDADEIQGMLLRSMSQARYQPENLGHFGLGYEGYTHFTSPIRRYPDLTTHRAIRSVIRSGKRTGLVRRVKDTLKEPAQQWYPYDLQALIELGEHCSLCERRADDATRDVIGWLKCEFMTDKIGDEFAGKITAVKPFGLFVQLNDYYVDGLVHISSLKSDYYHYHDDKQRLIGEATRKSYSLGDAVDIKVMRVDLDERKIDFELAGQVAGARKSKPGSKTVTSADKNEAKFSNKRRGQDKKPSDKVRAKKKPKKTGLKKKGAGAKLNKRG